MKNNKKERRTLHYRSTFFLPRNGNQDDLAVTFEVRSYRTALSMFKCCSNWNADPQRSSSCTGQSAAIN